MSIVRVGRGTIYVALQNIAIFIIGLIYYSILARLLTKSEIGLISTLTFIISLYSLLATLNLPAAATKYMSEYIGQSDREKASAVAKATLKLVLVLSTLLLAPALLIPWLYLGQNQLIAMLMMISGVVAFFAIIKSVYLYFLQGLQMFGRYSIAATLGITVNRSLSILLVLLNHGILGTVAGWLMGESISLMLAVYLFRGPLPNTETPYDSKQLLSFGLPLFVVSLINMASNWTDRILFLAVTSNLESLGVYDLAIRGSSTLSLIPMALGTTLLPAFSELFGRSDESQLSEPFAKASRYLAYLIFPAAFGLAAISKTAMALLYGWEYAVGNVPLSILALFSIFPAFGVIIGSTLQSMGETKVFIKIAAAMVLTDLAISIALIPLLDITGSTIARAAMMAVGFIYGYYELNRRIRAALDRTAISKALLASTLMVIPVGLFDALYSGITLTNPIINIIIEVTMGILIYGLALIMLKALNKEDFNILRQVAPSPITKIINTIETLFIRQ